MTLQGLRCRESLASSVAVYYGHSVLIIMSHVLNNSNGRLLLLQYHGGNGVAHHHQQQWKSESQTRLTRFSRMSRKTSPWDFQIITFSIVDQQNEATMGNTQARLEDPEPLKRESTIDLPPEVLRVWNEVAMHLKNGTQGELRCCWFDSIQRWCFMAISIRTVL